MAQLNPACAYAFLHNFDCEDGPCKCAQWIKVEVDRELIKMINNGEKLDLGNKCETFGYEFTKLERIQKVETTPNTVAIVGYPKAGSHLLMSILDELGVKSTEDFDMVSRDIVVKIAYPIFIFSRNYAKSEILKKQFRFSRN
mgnify:CR=1 FL=1